MVHMDLEPLADKGRQPITSNIILTIGEYKCDWQVKGIERKIERCMLEYKKRHFKRNFNSTEKDWNVEQKEKQ